MTTFERASLRRIRNISAFSGLKTGLKTGVASLMSGSWLKRAQAFTPMQSLHGLDDHMLKDMGLSRADLQWAERQTGFNDPTEALQALRRRREYTVRKPARAAS